MALTLPLEDTACATRLVLGSLEIDRSVRQVHVCGHRIALTRCEFEILYRLAAHRGETVRWARLLRRTGQGRNLGARAVAMHVKSIRRKLGAQGDAIQSECGTGYRLEVAAFAPEAAPAR